MIKKQFRNRQFACLSSEMVMGFPPYVLDGKAIPNHSMCEVMDDSTLRVVALYKLHDSQWYRYDLVSVYPPYPPQPQPLVQSIALGLVVPNVPVVYAPVTGVVYVAPVSISNELTVPEIPTISEAAI
jgi:hypothetical protein